MLTLLVTLVTFVCATGCSPSVTIKPDLKSPIEVVGGQKFVGRAPRYMQNGIPVDGAEMINALEQSKETTSPVRESIEKAQVYGWINLFAALSFSLVNAYSAGTIVSGVPNWTTLGAGIGLLGVAFVFRFLSESELDHAVLEHNKNLGSEKPKKSAMRFVPQLGFTSNSGVLGIAFRF